MTISKVNATKSGSTSYLIIIIIILFTPSPFSHDCKELASLGFIEIHQRKLDFYAQSRYIHRKCCSQRELHILNNQYL